ncbi:hypothetical protein NQ318_020682, partial [Aromia moschata]
TYRQAQAWILKLRIGKPVSKFMRVCSLHFAEEDYFYRLFIKTFQNKPIQLKNVFHRIPMEFYQSKIQKKITTIDASNL